MGDVGQEFLLEPVEFLQLVGFGPLEVDLGPQSFALHQLPDDPRRDQSESHYIQGIGPPGLPPRGQDPDYEPDFVFAPDTVPIGAPDPEDVGIRF